jgi:hypothetical protein
MMHAKAILKVLIVLLPVNQSPIRIVSSVVERWSKNC